MFVSCLMPTFNRAPSLLHLVEEAIESFLRQSYKDSELLICNDAPGQKLTLDIDNPRIKIFNLDSRLETLSDKLQFLIDQSTAKTLGTYGAFCRWDDDDISLPNRLAHCVRYIQATGALEYRAESYWYDTGTLREVHSPGNTHITGVWTNDALKKIGGKYPPKRCGDEDQMFNRLLAEAGINTSGEILEKKDFFYIYRWATGSRHLSGSAPLICHYAALGAAPIEQGTFVLRPRWYRNYVAASKQACRIPDNPRSWETLNGYFDYEELYSAILRQAPARAKLVEIGCFGGKSLCYLAQNAKRFEKRIEIFGVDLGIGTNEDNFETDFAHSGNVLTAIRECGVADNTTLIAGESTRAANVFADESIWFAFIDAAHSFNDTLADVQAWLPKIQPGGIIAGHDYGSLQFPGVAEAVKYRFGENWHSFANIDNLPRVPGVWYYRK